MLHSDPPLYNLRCMYGAAMSGCIPISFSIILSHQELANYPNILGLDCATTYPIAPVIWKLAGSFYNHMLLYVLMNITSCSNLGSH